MANITVDLTRVIATTDPLGVGICCSEFGGNPVPLVSNAGGWHDRMTALAPGVIRASVGYYGGNPGYGAGGSSRTPGTAAPLIAAIKSAGAIPLVSYNGDSIDNGGLTTANAAALVHYFNDGGGQHNGPVKYWSIGNEPEVSGPTPDFAGISAAMMGADPTIIVGAPAAAYWNTGLIGTVTGNANIKSVSWHEYDGANSDGSGFPADSNYQPHCTTAKGWGKMFGIEEANWDPTGGTTPNDWRNTCFIADIAGIMLANGGHLNVYGDWNGTLGILSDGSAGALGTPMASYYGLGIHTGMNGQFRRYGTHMMSCSTTFPASTLTAFASDSNKIVVVNKSASAQALSIALTLPGGATSGTYNVWVTSGTSGLSAISNPVSGAAFSGSLISYSLAAGRAASIDITPAGGGGGGPSAYDSQVLALDPAAYWKLADATGAPSCADSSGNGWAGTPNAGVTLGRTDYPIAGSTETAAAFAQASLGAVATSFQQSFTALTVEAWVNREGGTAAGYPRIIAQDTGNPNGFSFGLNDGVLYGECAPGGTHVSLTGPALPPTGWHHAVMRYTGTELSLWLDGVKGASLTGLSGTLPATGGG